MAEVYRLSADGGSSSPRFAAYVAAGRQGLPVHGYNPMTTKPVLETVEALLAIDAEHRLDDVAGQVGARLGVLPERMFITVAAPGMWTDPIATEADHRVRHVDVGSVLWWCGEPTTPERFHERAVAQAVRAALHHRDGPATSLLQLAGVEGAALAAAGSAGVRSDVAADVLTVLGEDDAVSTKVAFLLGDAAASHLGHPSLGLDGDEGARHAVWLAQRRGVEPSARNS